MQVYMVHFFYELIQFLLHYVLCITFKNLNMLKKTQYLILDNFQNCPMFHNSYISPYIYFILFLIYLVKNNRHIVSKKNIYLFHIRISSLTSAN